MKNSINNSRYFSYSIDNDEQHVMHSKGDNIEIMINIEVVIDDEVD